MPTHMTIHMTMPDDNVRLKLQMTTQKITFMIDTLAVRRGQLRFYFGKNIYSMLYAGLSLTHIKPVSGSLDIKAGRRCQL
jgi:hypothetical protein